MSDCDDQSDHRSCSDEFDIINRIGSGSFGTVYKVKSKQDDDIYVVKNIRISELSKREQLEAINEVDLMAKMDSPYVVKYLDSFLDKNCLQIVMEYCNKGEALLLLLLFDNLVVVDDDVVDDLVDDGGSLVVVDDVVVDHIGVVDDVIIIVVILLLLFLFLLSVILIVLL